jgi:TetR/AcrR family transcriptional regulator, cholesterol catabolism regulator
MAKLNRKKPNEETTSVTDIEKILVTAARLFRESGYHGTSMQDIANEVGILKGSLYHHIESKEELLLILLRASVDDVLATMKAAEKAATGPREKLRHVIRAELAAMAKHQDEILIWLAERGHMNKMLSEITRRANAADQVLRRIVQEGISAGIWREARYPIAFYAIRGIIISFPQWYKASGPLSVETIADQFGDYAERILN